MSFAGCTDVLRQRHGEALLPINPCDGKQTFLGPTQGCGVSNETRALLWQADWVGSVQDMAQPCSEQSQLSPLSLPLQGRKGCPWWSCTRAQTWWHRPQTHWDGTVRRACTCPGFPSGSWLILHLTYKGLIFSQSFWNALKEAVHTKEPQIPDRQERSAEALSHTCVTGADVGAGAAVSVSGPRSHIQSAKCCCDLQQEGTQWTKILLLLVAYELWVQLHDRNSNS